MDLHPREATERFYSPHRDALAVVHGLLDISVQDVAARWDDRYPDLRKMYGGGLSASVRLVFRTMAHEALKLTTLRPSESANGGQHLYDGDGNRVRVRKRPVSATAPWLPQPVTETPTESLFGTDINSLSYEVAVLWVVDFRARSLGRTVLAAVDGLDDWPNTKIYYEIPLPPPDLGGGRREKRGDHDGGFSEDDSGTEEGFGWGA